MQQAMYAYRNKNITTPNTIILLLSEKDIVLQLVRNWILPQISNSADKVQRTVSQRYQRIFAEQDSFSPHRGLSKLGKNYSRHAGLNQQNIIDVGKKARN